MKEVIENIIEKLGDNNYNIDINNKKVQWIIPCNPSQYDVVGAFKGLKRLEWKQGTNINVGDIVFIYISKPIQEIKYKCIVTKVNLLSVGRIDDSKFIIDDTNYKNNGRYMELEFLEMYSDKLYYIELLREFGIKSVQGPMRMSENLSNYINNTNDTYSSNKILRYEREVISIPAAGTIELIYKYKIHAHPNNNKRYPYKKALFYTFREKGGIMNKLYELNKIITLNPNNIASIDTLDIDKYSKERLKGYIEERKKTYTFHEDGEYKFYILNKPIELINKVYLPKQKKHVYFTIKEIYSGKEMINSSNDVTINNRVELFDIIKKNSSVDYIELEKKNIDLDTTIIEGKKVVTIKEIKKRNSLARRLKLDDFREKYGKVYCEVCGIDDELVLDVNHDETKVADMEECHVTKLEDLRVVCANCHRKIHGLNITVDKLINISKL